MINYVYFVLYKREIRLNPKDIKTYCDSGFSVVFNLLTKL